MFKVLVRKTPDESWVVFRRYTDFSRLNDKVRCPSVRPGSLTHHPCGLSQSFLCDLFADTLMCSACWALFLSAQYHRSELHKDALFPNDPPAGDSEGKQRTSQDTMDMQHTHVKEDLEQVTLERI